MTAEWDERVGIGERGEIAAIELRAVGKVGDRFERCAATRFDNSFRTRFGEALHHAETEAQ